MTDPDHKRRILRENWYRDVWLFFVTCAVVVGLIAYGHRTTEVKELVTSQHTTLDEIQSGRQATAGITCAVSAAVVNAGRLVIVSLSEQPFPPKLEKLFELPPKSVRRAKAQEAAQEYTNNINREVVRAAGVEGKRVLEPRLLPNGKPNPAAGSLNCKKLRLLAKIK